MRGYGIPAHDGNPFQNRFGIGSAPNRILSESSFELGFAAIFRATNAKSLTGCVRFQVFSIILFLVAGGRSHRWFRSIKC